MVADCGLRISLVSPSPCLLVSLSLAIRRGEYAERDVLQYAVADNQQAFIAEFSRDRAQDHPAQFLRGLIEFGFPHGLPRMLLLERFGAGRLIAQSEQLLNAPRGLIDFLSLRKAVTADRIRRDQP